MLEKLYRFLLIDQVLVDHEYENYERHMSRTDPWGREIEWCEETGHPTKFCGPQPPIPFWLFLLFDHIPYVIKLRTRLAYCKYRGHDWVDTSYGGPESGYMSSYCNTCGTSYHHTLY